ncbi:MULTISPECIES: response regulator [unclassified Methanoculleus]|nr:MULTISPECIES: response regulator [unclassified Methanoculleus]MDD2253470.1 response regulator [Methanoculleus sp.]MDD2787526.1 response regulator [Methanoculleus sp.]MDD3215414.1 response regulator [Methanoculleus sp.]MDD4314260.1 response regulator [Methanoculleus sp.]MDD4470016.1 response regulator [Methanoculleus sp.]
MSILVVEDSRTQAEYLRHILETEGYDVTLAADGATTLRRIEAAPPDIVLTDVLMPGMDGYELCRRIKQMNAEIPVIMVTSLFDPADVMKGLESGADSFIVKPVTPGHVRTQIEAVLRTAEMPDPDGSPAGLEVPFSGSVYTISAGRLKILNTLLSTYSIAVTKNTELQEVQEQLHSLNDQLQEAVGDLSRSNESLVAENQERRRVEKALADANRKLQLMASITRHDLLNQLSALWGYLDLALTLHEREPANAWRHVESARGIVDRISNTLRFTAEYQDVGAASPVWQEVRSLVERAEKYLTMGTITLENAVPVGVAIYADPLIEKVFSNLIENALRYGGTITTITFSLRQEGDAFTIICEDDGVGVARDEKEKIFTYAHGMNTGLGLFLAREILAITGIAIKETGVPGKGARFEIRCPAEVIRVDGRGA